MTKEPKPIYFVSSIVLYKDEIPHKGFCSWDKDNLEKYPFPVTIDRLGFFFEESQARSQVIKEWIFTSENNCHQWIVIEKMYPGFYSNYYQVFDKTDNFTFFICNKDKKDEAMELHKIPEELLHIYEEYDKYMIFAWD